MKRIRALSEAECETLRAAWKDGPNGRVRQRAQAVYLAHRGYGRIARSALFEVGVDTISAWLDGWERAGLRGLYDEPRAGRPPIYTPNFARAGAAIACCYGMMSSRGCCRNRPSISICRPSSRSCRSKRSTAVIWSTRHRSFPTRSATGSGPCAGWIKRRKVWCWRWSND
jgi:hypothetical protein